MIIFVHKILSLFYVLIFSSSCTKYLFLQPNPGIENFLASLNISRENEIQSSHREEPPSEELLSPQSFAMVRSLLELLYQSNFTVVAYMHIYPTQLLKQFYLPCTGVLHHYCHIVRKTMPPWGIQLSVCLFSSLNRIAPFLFKHCYQTIWSG